MNIVSRASLVALSAVLISAPTPSSAQQEDSEFESFVPNVQQVAAVGVGNVGTCLSAAKTTMAMVKCHGDEIVQLEAKMLRTASGERISGPALKQIETWQASVRETCRQDAVARYGAGSLGGVDIASCYRRQLLRRLAWRVAVAQDADNLSGLSEAQMLGNWVLRNASGGSDYDCYSDIGNLTFVAGGKFGEDNQGGTWKLDGRTILVRFEKFLNTSTGEVETIANSEFEDWGRVGLYDGAVMLIRRETEVGEVREVYNRCPAR